MIITIKYLSKYINSYLRNLRYTIYLKLKKSSNEIVDTNLFNKNYLGKNNELTEIMNNF